MKGKNLKITVGALIIVAAIAYLIISGMGSAQASYYLPVEQALSGKVEQGKFYRIEGKIDVATATFDGNKTPVELKFQIYNETDPSKKLNVIFNDVKPDNFKDATGAVVEGKFNSDGTFMASKLLLQCPSKYEAEQK
ncbi:MAG TPA: cytochrome c maturation protein CcmE [Candidatus Deferrimicrobium sp.]|nr:cytochrome c maturation protein CcmE [Candidatus Deferrimicrobium sp.]